MCWHSPDWRRWMVGCLLAVTIFSWSGGAEEKRLYEGKTLKVLTFFDAHSQAVFAHLGEFESMTGAHVDFDMVMGDEIAPKVQSPTFEEDGYDLITVDEPFVPLLADLLLPLSAWPSTRVMMNEHLALNVFLPETLMAGSYKGVRYGVPVSANVYVYIYRVDVFSDVEEQNQFENEFGYSLKVPQSPQELLDVARFFTRPPDLYGFAPITEFSEGTTVEALWAMSLMGAELFDTQGELIMDVDAVERAFAFYKELMKCVPPREGAWHERERISAYSRGQVVQMMEWPSMFKRFEDFAFSRVAGNSGYGLSPKGVDGKNTAVAGTWTLAIHRKTHEAALAAEFANWWVSKKLGEELVLRGINPGRLDLLTDPLLKGAHPWFDSVVESFDQSRMRPRTKNYSRFSEYVSTYFVAMVNGELSPRKAAEELKAALESMNLQEENES